MRFLLLAVLAVSTLIPLAHGQGTPTIDTLSPETGTPGDPVTITGKNFGTTQGEVRFGKLKAKTSSWTDTSINTVVPAGAGPGTVTVVMPEGAVSNGKAFVLTTPEYDQSSFEVLTGVGAVLAGMEATSYKVDATNNALSQTNVGRKTVEILLGGGFILPWHWGGRWIQKSYCGSSTDCKEGDSAYRNYRPWETFLSIRFAPASDQVINGFVVGGGYRITKYFSLLAGYSVTPTDEPSHGFRAAASQVVSANPTIAPYNHFSAADLLNNKPGAFDGFPLFLYDANGVTTTKIFPTSPVVTHYRSGVYFGVGIPLNFTAFFKPSGGK
jgi:hypothetical protein